MVGAPLRSTTVIFNLVDRPDSTLVGFGDDYDDHDENDSLDDGPDITLVVFEILMCGGSFGIGYYSEWY